MIDPDPLHGVQIRLARAGQHLRSLESEIALYDADDGYMVRGEFKTEPDEVGYLMSAHMNRPVPSVIAPLIGDCINNIRCSLDYLAWELVRLAGNTPNTNTKFPIHIEEPKKGAQIAGGIDSAALACIKGAQPYTRGDQAPFHPLAILQKLSNADKHHELLVTVIGMANTSASIAFGQGTDPPDVILGGQLRPGPFEHDAPVAWFPGLTEPDSGYMNVDLDWTTLVEVEVPGPVGRVPVVETLTDLIECARDGVIGPITSACF